MKPQRLLLLNPPSRVPVFRDCYCSGRTKGPFSIHPLDLQMQSGFFSSGGFQVDFLDAVFERLTSAETLKRIVDASPASVFALAGLEVLDADAAFFRELKSALPDVRIFLSGDIARFNPQRALDAIPESEGLLLDFASPSLFRYLTEGRAGDDMVLRMRPIVFPGPFHRTFSLPVPLVTVVQRYAYRLPFFRATTYYSLATSFGCHFSCAYCNTGQLGIRLRDTDECLDELRFASRLGYRSIYFRDATFFSDRSHSLSLIETWQRAGLRFEWICFTRPDLIDEEVADVAAGSGCRLMMMGVESHDEDCLRGLGRDIPVGVAARAFRILRKKLIPTAAGIILGLHTEGYGGSPDMEVSKYRNRLSALLRRLDPDYLAINVYSVRPGTDPNQPVLNALEKQRAEYQRLAGKISRSFYLRPKSILRAVCRVRSIDQFALQTQSCLSLLTS